MDQFTHVQHNFVLWSGQKAAATKIALEAIFVMCRSDTIGKTALESIFVMCRSDTIGKTATENCF